MEALIKDEKSLRISPLITNNTKTNKVLSRSTRALTRPVSDALKYVSNKMSTLNITTKKHSEADFTVIPLSKTISDIKFRTITKNKKAFTPQNNIKNANSKFNVNGKNIKKDVTSKIIRKQEISNRNKISNKQVNQAITPEKNFKKINNINTKSTTQESKLKSKTASKIFISKNVKSQKVKNQNVKSPVLTSDSHSKIPLKNKAKKTKILTKSEIFDPDRIFTLEDPFLIASGNFDLADIIEASLKNIRSPRSIFDHDFTCIQQSNKICNILDVKNEIQNIDKLNQSTMNNIANNFSDKIIDDNRILKHSKKSETFHEISNESSINDNITFSEGNNKSFSLSKKYIKAREELRKSLDWKQNNLISSQNKNLHVDINS